MIKASGADIEAEIGTPIRAPAPGVILSAGYRPAFGNYTCMLHELDPKIEGASTVTSCYGNQPRIDVAEGDPVSRGETIGAVGCSGPCLRPHLHLEVRLGSSAQGETVDPVPFFGEKLEIAPPGRSLQSG